MKRELNLFFSDLDDESLDETCLSNLSAFDIYSSDVSTVSALNSDKNKILLTEISIIVNDLNNLFLRFGFDSNFFEEHRIAWIADKVDYCLKHTDNKELICMLKEEYSKYLLVSSKIIEGNLRLVVEVAGGYKETSLFDYNDIIQYGNIGLMKAVEKYNIECGTTFCTYAKLWIKQVIGRNINGVKSSYRVPAYAFYDGYSLMQKKRDLDMTLGRESTVKELSEYVGLSISKVEKLKQLFANHISLDEDFGLYYGDNKMTVGDMTPDPSVDVYQDGTYSVRMEELKKELMKCLTERQYEVISKYIGIDGINYTREEIASMLNITPQCVGHFKRDAIKRLSLRPAFINKLLD